MSSQDSSSFKYLPPLPLKYFDAAANHLFAGNLNEAQIVLGKSLVDPDGFGKWFRDIYGHTLDTKLTKIWKTRSENGFHQTDWYFVAALRAKWLACYLRLGKLALAEYKKLALSSTLSD